jgi:multiple sugar transport system substrate-binding protein
MKRLLLATAIALGFTAPVLADEKIVVEFAYPYPHLFDVTYEKQIKKFNKVYPHIEIKMRAAYESYEDGTNTVLREALSGNLPDVSMQGLNRQAIFVEKGIAKSLEPFIAKESNFAKEGYHKAMLELGTFNGKVYGLPFSVSLPVGYYNMDLMKKAGITAVDQLPRTWSAVIDTCKKLRSAGVKNPMFWGWNITGNWFLQALMWSQGEPTVIGNKLNIDGAAGLKSLETMKSLFRGCEMQNLEWKAALKSFSAGEIGMMYWSTSAVGAVERAKGDFKLVTNEFPGIGGSPKGLPAGGNSAMMVSTSKDPKELDAAWKWLKFITSGEGAADVARTTGYMPPNKAANEIILKDFYSQNPTKATAVRQLPLLREWQAYPGDKGLAVTQVIFDGIERIVVGDADDMASLREELSEEASDLLPR